MDFIVDEIRNVMPDLECIILAGSFGRGEGSVLKVSGGRFRPLNDYDIYVFSRGTISTSAHQLLKKKLTERCEVRVDIKILNSSHVRNLTPDLFTYELKVASKLLWGKDLRDMIEVTTEEIPLRVALNTLFIEALGLLTCYDPTYANSSVPAEKSSMIDYFHSKTFVEIGDALSLLGGFYAPSLSERARRLNEHFKVMFPELQEALPDLPSLVLEQTEKKLMSLDFSSHDPIQSWFDSRRYLEQVLGFVISKVLGEPWVRGRLQTFLLKNRVPIARFYFYSYVKYAFDRLGVSGFTRVKKSLVPLAFIVENLRYSANMYHNNRILHRITIRRSSTLIDIYIAATLIMSSVKDDGELDSRALKSARSLMEPIYEVGKCETNALREWRRLKNSCLAAFSIYSSTPLSFTL